MSGCPQALHPPAFPPSLPPSAYPTASIALPWPSSRGRRLGRPCCPRRGMASKREGGRDGGRGKRVSTNKTEQRRDLKKVVSSATLSETKQKQALLLPPTLYRVPLPVHVIPFSFPSFLPLPPSLRLFPDTSSPSLPPNITYVVILVLPQLHPRAEAIHTQIPVGAGGGLRACG